MALVGAALVAAACMLAVVVAASVGSRPAEAQPREQQGQAPSGGTRTTNPLKYVTANSPNDRMPGGGLPTYKAVAQCPNDHRPISGGFDLHISGRDPWFILQNRPSRESPNGVGEPSNAWVVVAQTVARPPTPFTAYAVCAPESLVPAAGFQYTRGIVQVHPRNTQEIAPDCQRRFKAIGGGFSLANDSLYLIRSQPNPGNGFRSWIVAAGVPGGTSGGGELNAYSVCVREDLVKNLKSFDNAETGRGTVQVGTERCPQGTYLLSGGGGTSERDAEMLHFSHIRPGGGSQADPPKDWAVGAVSGDFPWVSKTVHAHALCGTLGDQQPGGGGGEEPPPTQPMLTKEACKNGGYAALGYENQGRCISAANKAGK